MEQVVSALKQISRIPNAFVDGGFAQGRKVIFEQLSLRIRADEAALLVDQQIQKDQQAIRDIEDWVKPFLLPEDYLFFLKYCGGIFIQFPSYRLIVNGVGPMVEDWYGFLMGDEAYTDPRNDGILTLGHLIQSPLLLKDPLSVTFFLDLRGFIKTNSILGIRNSARKSESYSEIMKRGGDFDAILNTVADSFVDWLHLLAKTDGKFNYL